MRSRRAAMAMAGALLAGPLHGAEPPAPATAAGTPQLEQIIVTAKRRKQTLVNVPQTVNVVSGRTLQNYSLQQFQDVQLLVAGLQLNDNGGQGQNIALRGITYDPDTTANPAVDLYVNEVPLSQTTSAFQDLFDMSQVEVVRGPQGTLRGRTSPAGAILLTTAPPDMNRASGYVQQVFSSNDHIETQFAAGAPLIPGKLAVRIAGLFDQNGLYGTRDVTTGQSDFNLQHAGRITVEARPTDALQIVVMHQDSNDRTRQFFGVSGTGSDGHISPGDNLAVEPGANLFYDRTDITTVEATYRLSENEFTYVGGYQAVKDEFQQEQDKGNLLRGFAIGSQLEDNGLEQLTQEVRFQSTGDQRFGYMVGAYYAHQDAAVKVFTPSETIFFPDPNSPDGARPVAEVNANVPIDQLVTDYALFTDETFKLTPDDQLEGGVRWQFERQYRASGYQVIIPPVFGGGTIDQQLISPRNQKEEYRAWTGLASYTHHFSPNLTLYATFGESFRPGGAEVGISLPLPESFLLFKPEKSYDFEIGGKGQLFGGRVRITADIFDQAYQDYISRQNSLYTYLGYQSITTNGDAVARGAEFDATAIVTDNWRINLNTTFTDAHYSNAKLPCNDFAGTGQPNTSGTPRVPPGQVSATCVTNASLGTPNWFVSFSSEYDVPLTADFEIFARGIYTFTPRYHNDLLATSQDPRSIANLYLGAHTPGGNWEGLFFIKNLFNTIGYSNLFGEQYDSGYLISGGIVPVNFDTGYASSHILRPREVGVQLTYRF